MTKSFIGMMVASCLTVLSVRGDVWQDLAAYKYGDSAEAGVAAEKCLLQTPLTEHGVIEEALIKIVSSESATQDGKSIACRLLQQVSTEKSIPALSGLLGDELLSHYARLALERMASAKADAALRAALDQAPDKAKIGIIGSLGERRDPLAVTQIVKLTQHPNQDVVAVALLALGKIGDKKAAEALLKLKLAEPYKTGYMQALVRCAGQLTRRQSAALYDKVLKEGEAPVRTAALAGLFRVDEKRAIQLSREILKGTSWEEQRGLLALIADGAGTPTTTQAMADMLANLPDQQKDGLITALGGRGDRAAMAVVTTYVASTNAAIHAAALQTLGKVGDETSVKLLLGLSATDPKAAEALTSTTIAEADKVLISALSDPALQVAASKMLMARSTSEKVVPLLINMTHTATDPVLRKAVWTALGSLATEDELPDIAAAAFADKDQKDLADALPALKRICAQARDMEKSFNVVAAYYDQATIGVKSGIIEIAAFTRGPSALALTRKALKSGDKELYSKALRALAAWTDLSAADDLLELAKTAPTETERILALRGYITIATNKDNKLMPELRSNMLKSALELAKRAEEKRLIQAALEEAAPQK